MLAHVYSDFPEEDPDGLSFLPQQKAKLRVLSSSGSQSQPVSLTQTGTSLDWWQTSSSRPVSIPQMDIAYLTQLDLLQQLYTVRGKSTEILLFLDHYPSLAPLLLKAYFAIRHFFPYTLLFLEVSSEPDEPGMEQLLISIGTTLGSDEAIERLEAFDRQWWLEMLRWTQNRVCITLEFQ